MRYQRIWRCWGSGWEIGAGLRSETTTCRRFKPNISQFSMCMTPRGITGLGEIGSRPTKPGGREFESLRARQFQINLFRAHGLHLIPTVRVEVVVAVHVAAIPLGTRRSVGHCARTAERV